MSYMFNKSKLFNQNISNWNLDNIRKCNYMFEETKAFLDKYNSGVSLPTNTNEIKEWLNNNRDRMNDIDIKEKHGDEVEGFFSNITDIHFTNGIGLHNNIHSLPISIP